jgi:CheY-like chemotaxis protein
LIWAESELGKGSAFHFRLPFLLNSPKDSPSEMSPKVSDKVNGRQSWSLMGGLIFNQPGKYQSESCSGGETRNLATRGRSTNDLLGLWKDNTEMVSPDDPDGNNNNSSPSPFQDASLRRGGLMRQASHGPDFTWTSPTRLHGGSVAEQRSSGKTLSDPEPVVVAQFVDHEPPKWDSLPSDRSVSNEVTEFGHKESLTNNCPGNHHPESWELVQPQNFVSASSQTSSTFSEWGVGSAFLRPHEGPMDSETPNGEETFSGVMERERGNVTGVQDVALLLPAALGGGGAASVRSDLSRESSVELEKMLVNKVSLKILLAEDNAINQKVASRQLEKHGHVVTIVGDGQQALDVISSRHDEFDLVLMDVQVLFLLSSLRFFF